MDRISAMTIFVRVVETGSFSTVARQMKTTQPTISKNIAELETWLGVKLLHRSTRSLHLTEAGTDYYERCVSIAMREALLAGYGITKVPKWLVGDALVDGRLVAVLNDFSHDRIDIFAVYPPGRHLALKARHFIDFFNEKLSLCDSIITPT